MVIVIVKNVREVLVQDAQNQFHIKRLMILMFADIQCKTMELGSRENVFYYKNIRHSSSQG